MRLASLLLSLGGSALVALGLASSASAQPPTSVTLAGTFQSELGCPGDWDPSCANTNLVYDATDDVWQAVYFVSEGTQEYKAALNGTWDVNYGQNGSPASNISFFLPSARPVKFYYDDATHWVASTADARIVTVPGNFQSELGCPGDWQPDCLRTWLKDVDGDGVFTMTVAPPPGTYEAKIAIGESWTENYGVGGAPSGANHQFTVAPGEQVTFAFTSATNTLDITTSALPVELSAFTGVADGTSALLRWTTESETTNAGFAIEHLRGATWTEEGFVHGRGTTSERSHYQKRVDGLAPGTHRFRLVQRDLDGTATVAGSVEVTIGQTEALALSVQSNGTDAPVVRLVARESGSTVVTVSDVMGRTVARYAVAADAGARTDLSVDGLAAGVYVVRASGRTGTATTTLVVR